ncbi:hypothetical protein KCU61_g610, partial [Aureobasidium melanogenum]
MFDDFLTTSTEATTSTEGAGERANDHVDLAGVDNYAELVLLLKLNELGEIDDIAYILEEALGDDETTSQGFASILFDQLCKDALKVFRVVVFLTALSATMMSPRLEKAGMTEEIVSGNVGFESLMDILCTIETRGTARTDTVGAQSLDSSLLDGFRVDKVEVVVGGKHFAHGNEDSDSGGQGVPPQSRGSASASLSSMRAKPEVEVRRSSRRPAPSSKLLLPLVCLATSGLEPGCNRSSKLSFRCGSRADRGLLLDAQLTWAGLGVTLQKSAKLKLLEGVLSANPKRPLLPPGVCIIDDGRGVVLDGGVDGAMTRALLRPFAGVAIDIERVHGKIGVVVFRQFRRGGGRLPFCCGLDSESAASLATSLTAGCRIFVDVGKPRTFAAVSAAMYTAPFLILTLASANLSWRALVICDRQLVT